MSRPRLDEFIVEEITSPLHWMRRREDRSGRMELCVKWLGHGPEENPGSLQELREVKARYIATHSWSRQRNSRNFAEQTDVDSETEEEDDFEGPKQSDKTVVRTTLFSSCVIQNSISLNYRSD
jgi:hypothetical protein